MTSLPLPFPPSYEKLLLSLLELSINHPYFEMLVLSSWDIFSNKCTCYCYKKYHQSFFENIPELFTTVYHPIINKLPGKADIHSLSNFFTSCSLTAPQRFTGWYGALVSDSSPASSGCSVTVATVSSLWSIFSGEPLGILAFIGDVLESPPNMSSIPGCFGSFKFAFFWGLVLRGLPGRRRLIVNGLDFDGLGEDLVAWLFFLGVVFGGFVVLFCLS